MNWLRRLLGLADAPTPELHDAARLVIGLLQHDPAGWVTDPYHLTHKTCGVSMWIANSYLSFALRIDGKAAQPSEFGDQEVYLDGRSRRALYEEVRRFIDGAQPNRDREVIGALARRILAEFDHPPAHDAASRAKPEVSA